MIAKPHPFLLLALAVSLAAPALAQDDDSDGVGQNRPGTLFIDIDFEGGTVSEYVDLLRELDPSARILCSEAASKTRVPPIKIKSVPLRIGVNALWTVTRNSFRRISIDDESFEDANNEEGVIFSIEQDPPLQEVQMEATVVNAKDALKALELIDPDTGVDLQSTIETGLSTVFDGDDAPAVVVKLHEPTGLLFVKGPEDRVRFVLEIIEQLSQNLHRSQ